MRPALITPLLALAACPTADKPDTADTAAPDTAADTDTADTDAGIDTDTDTADTATPDEADAVAPTLTRTGPSAGRYTFEADDLVLEVDPAVGGRVTRLALGGVELLTDPSVNADNYGATFWTSPQSAWNWPPPAGIDNAPYTAEVDGNALVLTSTPTVVGGATFVVEKRITVGDGVTQTYTIRNVGETDTQVAGWQVARVPAEGLTVWPAGNHVTGTLGAMPHVEQDGHVWIEDAPGSDAKVIADATGGWIAHVTGAPTAPTALLVTFPEVRLGDAAPGEGEVEVFAKGGGGYREVEVQSAYQPLPAGEALTWTVRWDVRPVPDDVPVVIGSTALLEFLTGSR